MRQENHLLTKADRAVITQMKSSRLVCSTTGVWRCRNYRRQLFWQCKKRTAKPLMVRCLRDNLIERFNLNDIATNLICGHKPCKKRIGCVQAISPVSPYARLPPHSYQTVQIVPSSATDYCTSAGESRCPTSQVVRDCNPKTLSATYRPAQRPRVSWAR